MNKHSVYERPTAENPWKATLVRDDCECAWQRDHYTDEPVTAIPILEESGTAWQITEVPER